MESNFEACHAFHFCCSLHLIAPYWQLGQEAREYQKNKRNEQRARNAPAGPVDDDDDDWWCGERMNLSP